jgi:hypothetical protein
MSEDRDAMTHINPGTDTTINPVIINDTYRERKSRRRIEKMQTTLMKLVAQLESCKLLLDDIQQQRGVSE